MITKETKWEDLIDNEKNAFNEIAKKHQNFLQKYKIVMENKTCFMCRYVHSGYNDLNFHINSTHGIPNLYHLINISKD